MYGFKKFSWILVLTNIWFSTSSAYDNGPYCNTIDAECLLSSCDERVWIDIISNSAITSTIYLMPEDAIEFGLEAIDINKEDKDITLPWEFVRSITMSLRDIEAHDCGECGHLKTVSNPESVFCISSSVGTLGAVVITLVHFLEDCNESNFVKEVEAMPVAQTTYEKGYINEMINCDDLASAEEDDFCIVALYGTSKCTPCPHMDGGPENDLTMDTSLLYTIKTGWTVEDPHLAIKRKIATGVFLASFLAIGLGVAWLRHCWRGARSKITAALWCRYV
ncbi:hypothetical protein LTR10_020263 [Elasticomyces elasticus]|uniref:Autophagy-related protein 27 n=1 Tax=Exophiala sideris TaxID=1016849 RepID=A0ABR0IVI3_9EURO|nr:hypothetical protein LTR10_020263 [Elasticomyces elasticus]KAK5021283.1 hypothetical protein LTS07_011122 [Exophiala sideris]KAK5024246.1 hypothetical protein LTR13_010955 [Exophiala sideris]KAK5049188.1 hypothetical protein LTR69_011152 [Exophiala sideris]KAK5176499.1 hypothetical protein LTR44_010977 [Eurotiomycetes sp. CCFEE 6388]